MIDFRSPCPCCRPRAVEANRNHTPALQPREIFENYSEYVGQGITVWLRLICGNHGKERT